MPFDFTLTHPQRLARRKRTEAGKAVHNAKQRAQRATASDDARPAKRASVVTAVDPSPAEAAELVEATYKATAGEKLTQSDSGGRSKAPRVYRTGKRVYGSRVIRWNQQQEA